MEGATVVTAASVGVDLWLAILGLVSGLVGIALSVVAIWQALHFYGQSKKAETATLSALDGIRGQTTTLAEISGQQLKGLTQIVREQVRAPDKSTELLVTLWERVTLSQPGGLIETQVPNRPPIGESISDHDIPYLPPVVDRAALREAAATMYFAIYYYTAHMNIFAQGMLPKEEDYNETDELHRIVRYLLARTIHEGTTGASRDR